MSNLLKLNKVSINKGLGLIILGLLFFAPLTHAQNNNDQEAMHDQDELFRQLEEIQKNNKALIEQAQKMQQGGGMNPGSAMDMLKALQGKAKGQKGAAAPGMPGSDNVSMSKTIATVLRPYQTMPRAQIIATVKSMTAGKPYQKFLDSNPKLYEFYADTLQSKDALPSAAGMLQNRNKLYLFAGLNVFIIICGVIFKRLQKNQTGFFMPFIKRMILIYGARITLLVVFFGKELGPIWRLFVARFF